MGAILAWLDHDSRTRSQMNEVLDRFGEDGTRDDLGIGGVRDALSDELFPGVTTVQTRLRYFLIVAWTYAELEAQKTAAIDVAGLADRHQRRMIRALKAKDPKGVFGRVAGERIKQLPDAVYWSGLRRWGIFESDLSRRQYQRQFERFWRHETSPWRNLPPVPEGFPDDLSLELTVEEAQYILERVADTQPGSMLHEAMLWVANGNEPDRSHPWHLPARTDHNRSLLILAQRFSFLVCGAALLHNLLLAEHKAEQFGGADAAEDIEDYRKRLLEWANDDELPDLLQWNPDNLLDFVPRKGRVHHFLRKFHVVANEDHHQLADSDAARKLVRRRVVATKGTRSRFHNSARLEQWRGDTGTSRLGFRWGTVRTMLDDLHRALHQETADA